MSWWESGGLGNFASQALKSAQKKIDKVLDIQPEDNEGASASDHSASGGLEYAAVGDDFFGAWLSPGESKNTSTSDVEIKKEAKSKTKTDVKVKKTLFKKQKEEVSQAKRVARSSSIEDESKKCDSKQDTFQELEIEGGREKDKDESISKSQVPDTEQGVNEEDKTLHNTDEKTSSLKEYDKGPSVKGGGENEVARATKHSCDDDTKIPDGHGDGSSTEVKESWDNSFNDSFDIPAEKNRNDGENDVCEEKKSIDPRENYDNTIESEINDEKARNNEVCDPTSELNESTTSTGLEEDRIKESDINSSTDTIKTVKSESSLKEDMGQESKSDGISGSTEGVLNTDHENQIEPGSETKKEEQHLIEESVDNQTELLTGLTETDQSENSMKTFDSQSTLSSGGNLSTSHESTEFVDENNRTLTQEDFEKMKASLPSDSSKMQETSEESLKEASSNQNLTDSAQSIGSSFVKCMLEEAMVESLKDTDSDPSEKSSEIIRIDSGHTSGDEIETTTSSDIEIISTSTTNGQYGIERPFDLSPLRHALKSVRRGSPPGHKRSDSGSSGKSSNFSKNGDESSSPEESQKRLEAIEKGLVKHGTKSAEGTASIDPLDKDKLLKECKSTPNLQPIIETSNEAQALQSMDDVKWLKEKLAEMAEVLDAREKKLVNISRENMDLQEANSILRNQLHQCEEAREAEMADINTLTDEFTVRMGEAEKRLTSALREKETMKKKLQQAEKEIAKKVSSSASVEKLLREKDEQIAGLMEEGEKLSKQQLQTNNIIKKLRAKEKENEPVLKQQKQKLEEQKAEIEHLQKVLDSKEELEKKQIEAINQFDKALKKKEQEILQFQSDLEDANEKLRGMQVALDNSYKEMAGLHKQNAAKASEAQEARLSAELVVKEELKSQLEKLQAQMKTEQESLFIQIEDLQLSMSRMEKEHSRREDILKQEISDLNQRLQDGEERNQELTQSVSAATRPLLRQIENLQSTYAAQSMSYEKVEKNLTDRLGEAQSQLAVLMEKERFSAERIIELTSKLNATESQLAVLRQEKSQLTAKLEMEKTRAEMLEESRNNENIQLQTLKQGFTQDITELKKEKVLLENALEVEKMKLEAEKKKLVMAHENLREKELQLQRHSARSPSNSAMSISRADSVTSDLSMSYAPVTQEEVLERTLSFASSNGNKTSLYESLRSSGAATFVEALESRLKQKEGEVAQLHSEITELEKTRESMARELVNLSTQNEDLQDQLKDYPELKKQYNELDQRYQALLQMYGEKDEETQELRLDLQDVKDMYKLQIEELLKKQMS